MAVAAVSPDDVWAVGGRPRHRDHTLVEHYDGMNPTVYSFCCKPMLGLPQSNQLPRQCPSEMSVTGCIGGRGVRRCRRQASLILCLALVALGTVRGPSVHASVQTCGTHRWVTAYFSSQGYGSGSGIVGNANYPGMWVPAPASENCYRVSSLGLTNWDASENVELGMLIDTAHVTMDDSGHACYPSTTDTAPYVLTATVDNNVFYCEYHSDLTSWSSDRSPFWISRSAGDDTRWNYHWNLGGTTFSATLYLFHTGGGGPFYEVTNTERVNTSDSMWGDFTGVQWLSQLNGSWSFWSAEACFKDNDGTYDSYKRSTGDASHIQVSTGGTVTCSH